MRLLIRLINIIVGIVVALLGLRLLLKLLGASPRAPFVDWVYDTTLPLIQPFIGMFPSPVVEGRFILEFTTIFAVVIYALVGYLFTELIWFIRESVHRHEPHHEH